MEEKQIQDQVQVQVQIQIQEALKCPRCDSSNTKFCYYNNYSLSQPRHFCKACKRYWTRGGTLRNVPVGGGYRKNKKVKRGNSNQEIISSSSSTQLVNPSHHLHQSSSQGLDTSMLSTRSHINNPFLYSLLTNNQPQLNLNPYSLKDTYGLNLPHQFKVGGTAGELGFSSVMSQKTGGGGGGGEHGFSSVTSTQKTGGAGELGFSSVTSTQKTGGAGELGFSSVTSTQNLGITHGNMSLASLNIPLVSNTYNNPIFGTSTSTSTMGTSQHKVATSGFNDIAQTHYGSIGFDDLQMLRNSNNEGFDLSSKNVKMEGYGSWFDSQTNQNYIQEQIDSMDPSFMWNSSSSNIGC